MLVEVIWPEFIAELEAGEYANKLFVPIRFVDFTPGYDTNSAVLFPETVAMREIPTFTWGAIFQDREAARFRRVVRAAAEITKLELPADAARMLDDQALTEETFVMWDLIHDRSHMRGDLPFDPFMIKQRMPFFLYSLEELRCDLTAFRESVRLERELSALPERSSRTRSAQIRDHAQLVQYAVIFDRIFRFAITGSRVRNYDGLGGQLLFAWMHQHHVLHWTDTQLTIDWDGRSGGRRRAQRRDQRALLAFDRPPEDGALAGRVRDAHRRRSRRTRRRTGRAGCRTRCSPGVPKGYTDRCWTTSSRCRCSTRRSARRWPSVIESTAGITRRRLSIRWLQAESRGPARCLIAGATSAERRSRRIARWSPRVRRCSPSVRGRMPWSASNGPFRGVDTRVCDLADRSAVAELAMRVHVKFGRIDGLVHLVGGWRGGGGITGQTDEDWEFLDRAFTTLRNTTRVFYDDLVASPAGRLAIVSSTAVEHPLAGRCELRGGQGSGGRVDARGGAGLPQGGAERGGCDLRGESPCRARGPARRACGRSLGCRSLHNQRRAAVAHSSGCCDSVSPEGTQG